MSKGFFCNFNQIQKVITVSKIVMKIFIDEIIYIYSYLIVKQNLIR